MISTLLLGYYIVVALALLVFLAWGYIDDRRQTNWRRRKPVKGEAARATPAAEPERQTDPAARAPDNVVKFRRGQ